MLDAERFSSVELVEVMMAAVGWLSPDKVLLIVLVLAVVLGPLHFPRVARSAGRSLREWRRSTSFIGDTKQELHQLREAAQVPTASATAEQQSAPRQSSS